MAAQDQLNDDIRSGRRKADVIDEEMILMKAKSRANVALLKSFANNYLQQVIQFMNYLPKE